MQLIKAIQQVPWTHLAHAYGRADDVPEQLHRIINPSSEEELEEAIQWFWATLLHQGSVYSASIPAIWVLIELIKIEPTHPVVASIFSFIDSIAQIDWELDKDSGMTPVKVNQQNEPVYAIFVDKPLPTEYSEDSEAYSKAYTVFPDNVRALLVNAISVVENFLDVEDRSIQMEIILASLNLLKWLPKEAKSLNVIHSFVGNAHYDPSTWVHIGVASTSESTITSWLDSDDERLRLIGALNPLSKSNTQSLEILAYYLIEQEWISKNFPIYYGLHFQILYALLERTSSDTAPSFVIHAIAMLIKKRAPLQTWKKSSFSLLSADAEVRPILRWAFEERIAKPPYIKASFAPLPNKLTALQSTILKALCSEDAIWDPSNGNMTFAYTCVHLPYDREILSELVASSGEAT